MLDQQPELGCWKFFVLGNMSLEFIFILAKNNEITGNSGFLKGKMIFLCSFEDISGCLIL